MQRVVAIIVVLIFIISVIFWISAAISEAAYDDSACATCHSDDVDEAQTRLFVHAPFRNGKCGACHVPDAETADSAESDETPQPVSAAPERVDDMERIAAVDVHWLCEYFEPVQNLLLPLSAAEVKSMLVVELWDQCRGEHQHVVPLPPLQQARPLPPQNQGEVQIHSFSIKRDPHRPDTVVVQCRTNVPVRGELRLRTENGEVRTLETPKGFHTRMEMHIQGLSSNARYKLEFAYAGIDGSDKRSPAHVFVPAQLAPQGAEYTAAPENPCELRADIHVYRGQCDERECYFLRVAANQPVTLSVGALKAEAEVPPHLQAKERDQSATSVRSGAAQQRSRFHADLAGSYFTNYESCRPCHTDFFGPMSHPVDIVPGVGMEVSPDLPLLEDGRISCMTCHVSHGGNDHYRLRFPTKQELCHACHDEY